MARKASSNVAVICRHFESLKLQAYKDPISKDGKPYTIGYGHTKNVQLGDVCDSAQAEQFLMSDIWEAELKACKYIKADIIDKLTEGQYDCIVDMFFNIRTDKLSVSTFVRLLNENKIEEAGEEIQKWTSKGVKGLVRRRKTDYTLFKQGKLRFYEN